jgi:hypothetical protein
MMNEEQLSAMVERYMSMWHERDAGRRRKIVEGLFAEDAENYTSKMEARGHEEIVARVARSHEAWVASKDYVFRAVRPAEVLHGVARFVWEMVPRAGGPIEARGLDIFILAADGRIRALYQFKEPVPA